MAVDCKNQSRPTDRLGIRLIPIITQVGSTLSILKRLDSVLLFLLLWVDFLLEMIGWHWRRVESISEKILLILEFALVTRRNRVT